MLMIMITLAQTDRLVDSGLREKLAEFHLRENPSKRVYFEISHNVRSQPEFKKLGCLLDSRQDLKQKMQLALVAFGRAWNLWHLDKADIQTKLKVFKACIHPILLYIMGASSALTWSQLEALDSFHRKLLRWVMNIHYPDHISNERLYEITGMEPISVQVIRARWKLFGHVLRQPPDTPAQQAMQYFFSYPPEQRKRGGAQAVTIAQALDADIRQSEVHEAPARLLVA
jgi:hypothetical protein